jgi:hypothetical protein
MAPDACMQTPEPLLPFDSCKRQNLSLDLRTFFQFMLLPDSCFHLNPTFTQIFSTSPVLEPESPTDSNSTFHLPPSSTMKIDLALADTLAQKRELDVLVASRKGKQRAEFPLFHRTRRWMLANFTVAAVCRPKLLVRCVSIMADHYNRMQRDKRRQALWGLS